MTKLRSNVSSPCSIAGIVLGLLLQTLLATFLSAETFSLSDEGVLTVDTPRFTATFESACLTSLHAKPTGEDFASPAGDWRQRACAMSAGLNALNPDASSPLLRKRRTSNLPDNREKPTLQSIAPDSVRVTWPVIRKRGNGSGIPSTIVLKMRLLPTCGDLEIHVVGGSPVAGVYGTGLGLLNFRRDLTWIFPVLEGRSFVPADEPIDPDPRTTGWPFRWAASLVVAESKRGGAIALWMTDPEMGDRALHWQNNEDALDIVFQSIDDAPFLSSTTSRSRTIRLNVYEGNWVTAARPFRDHWERTFDVKPLAEREPAWLADIFGMPSGYDTPPEEWIDKVVIWAPQRWKVGPEIGDPGLFPYDMSAGPQLDQLKGNRERERELGVHRMVYLNINHMNEGHPKAPEFWSHRLIPVFGSKLHEERDPKIKAKSSFRVHCAYRPWQDLIINWAKQTQERHGISGFYMDCAGVTTHHRGGLVSGLNDIWGQVDLMKRMKREIPGCFLSCEYLNEVTAQVVDFGMFGKDHWLGGSEGKREKQVHPIGGFLFNRYAKMHRGFNPAFHEVLGKISWPKPPKTDPADITDYAQTVSWWHHFFLLQAETGMVAEYPEKWDPDVRAYYRSADGTAYRVYSEIRPEGRMVRMLPDGGEELLYWRIKGRCRAKLEPGTGIGGWIAYSGDEAIGLNPAKGYLYLGQPRIEDWQVKSLPEGAYIDRQRPYRDGMLVLELAPIDEGPVSGHLEVTSKYPLDHALVDGALQSLTAEVEADGKHLCRIEVQAPGQVALFSSDAVRSVDLPYALADSRSPLFAYHEVSGIRAVITKNNALRQTDGLLQLKPLHGQLGVVEYLLKLPEIPADQSLQLQMAGNMTRDGNRFTACAWVNGKSVISEKVEGENSMQACEADLTPFAGHTILLTLGVDRGYLFRHAQLVDPRILVNPR